MNVQSRWHISCFVPHGKISCDSGSQDKNLGWSSSQVPQNSEEVFCCPPFICQSFGHWPSKITDRRVIACSQLANSNGPNARLIGFVQFATAGVCALI